jgi:hypothetical protein
MQKHTIAALVVGLTFLSTAGYAQSLGDVARQQRQKAGKASTTPRKVVTDEDLPSHPAEQNDGPATPKSKQNSDDSASGAPINSSSNAEQVKASFLAQKQKIKDFENQLNELRSSVHYVEANRYTNGVQYNQYQLRKQQEADRMQKQLDEAKKNLQSQQEAARKAGFGSGIYDP